MLQGFLADEPQGAHSAEAWSRLGELQLEADIKSADAESLRGWLAGHPTAAGREQAERALEEAEFREAIAAPLPHRGEQLRAFIAAHPAGVHRAEAEQLETDRAVEDAFILEDENELRAWAKSGNSAAKDRLDQLSLEQAAARLDLADLKDLIQDGGAGASRKLRAPRRSSPSSSTSDRARRSWSSWRRRSISRARQSSFVICRSRRGSARESLTKPRSPSMDAQCRACSPSSPRRRIGSPLPRSNRGSC